MDIELKNISTGLGTNQGLSWQGQLCIDGCAICVLGEEEPLQPIDTIWAEGFGPADLGAVSAFLNDDVVNLCRSQAHQHVLRTALREVLADKVMFRDAKGSLLSIDLSDGEDVQAVIRDVIAADPAAVVLNSLDIDLAVIEWLND